MNKRVRILAMTALLFVTSTVFAGSDQKNQAAPGTAPEQGQPTPATTDPSYIIGPEDVLQVNVWKEPELTQSVPVRPDGKISLPLLNDVQAAGFTPMELTSRLTTALKKYLEDPRVTITVTTVNSRRVFILGQVTHPGAFPLLSDMTVFQALSAAGGISEYAKATKIYVLRNENGKRVRLPFNYKDALRGQKQDQNFLLKPGDTIVVP
jgi:polysaccharide export outer membrane protein